MARNIIATDIVEEFNHSSLSDVLEFLIRNRNLEGVSLVVAEVMDKENIIHQKPCVLMAYLNPINRMQYLLYNKGNEQFSAHPDKWVLSYYTKK